MPTPTLDRVVLPYDALIELSELKAQAHRRTQLLLDELEAPWAGTIGFAKTQACVDLSHPRIHGEDKRPCYCGIVKPEREGEAT